MKKFLFCLALCVAFGARSFAADGPIPSAVLLSFEHRFTNATHVNTAYVGDWVRVSFQQNGHAYCAYYNCDGELAILAEQASLTDLPDYLRSQLESRYSAYTVSAVYRVNTGNKVTWHATLTGRRSLTLASTKTGWSLM